MTLAAKRVLAKVRTSILVALAFGAVACGGGGGSDPEPAERSAAQKQCDSLMAAWCDSALACVQAGLSPEDMLSDAELADERDTCVDVAKSTCDSALGVGEGYDECRASVETLEDSDCEAVRAAIDNETDVPMPASCEGLFTAG